MRRAAAGVALLVLAGCGGPPDMEAVEVRTASQPPPLITSAPGSPGPSLSPPPRKDCVSSTEEATARSEESPGPICLVVGATLHVTSTPSPPTPWEPLATSDASVLRCKSTVGPAGVLDGACQAMKPGTAVIGSNTWRLTVFVVG